jgi:hypothetical protein
MSLRTARATVSHNPRSIIREALLKAIAQMRLAETVAAGRDEALAARLLELSQAAEALISCKTEGGANG